MNPIGIGLGVGTVAAGIAGAGASRRAARANERGIQNAITTVQQGTDQALTRLDTATDYTLSSNDPYTSMGIGAMGNVNALLGIASPSAPTVDYASQLEGFERNRANIEQELEYLQRVSSGRGFTTEGYVAEGKYKGLHRDQLQQKIAMYQSKLKQLDVKVQNAQRLQAQQDRVQQIQQAQQSASAGLNAIRPFEFSGANFDQDPSYQFRLQQGLDALDRQYAARGGLGSGNRMLGITDYAQKFASTEYASAFDRSLAEWKSQFDVLNANMGILGFGMRANQSNIDTVQGNAANAANVISNASSNIAGMRGAQGSNAAAGIIGQNNALQQTLQNFAGLAGDAGWFEDPTGGGSADYAGNFNNSDYTGVG